MNRYSTLRYESYAHAGKKGAEIHNGFSFMCQLNPLFAIFFIFLNKICIRNVIRSQLKLAICFDVI